MVTLPELNCCKIVVSQPMFFPWVGIFEQIKLSDIYVHYDDVQLPMGRSFINRVQIKTKDGFTWLTVPLIKETRNGLINKARISYDNNWVEKHIKFLENNYKKAPFRDEMLSIVDSTYKNKFSKLVDLNIYLTENIATYLGVKNTYYAKSSTWKLRTKSSERLLEIVNRLNGTTYITGLGAKNYLNHELFEKNKIEVKYMVYKKEEYEQLFGDFNPYVSILDIIAMKGKQSKRYLKSNTVNWKEI